MNAFPPAIVTKRTIRRFAPLQLGKILAVLYGLMGLIAVPFFALISLAGSQLPPQQRVGLLAFGIGFAFLMPIFYAVMGFIVGTLGAFLYNWVAGWLGGIEVEVE